MGFDRTLPPPVYGVSTVPPVARPEGYAAKQTNWRNDAQEKLTKRPRFEHLVEQLPAWSITDDVSETFTSYQNGERREVAVAMDISANKVEVLHRQGYAPFTRIVADTPAAFYSDGAEVGINVIDKDVYIWNKKRPMQLASTPQVDRALYEAVSLINVTSALNYSEAITVEATIEFYDGVITNYETTYEVPGLSGSNQPAADEARATNAVAAALAEQLKDQYDDGSGPVTTYLATEAKGSNVYVRAMDKGATKPKSLKLEMSSGRGDSTILVMNYKLTSIDGLPKYCIGGVVRTVTPDPTSQDGVYYLEATPTTDLTVSGLTEVVWTETEDPRERSGFTGASCYFVVPDGTNTIETRQFDRRWVGDETSNPRRDFMDKPIQQMETFQDRLLILAGSKMNVSATDDYDRFFLNSALELLVTDPTDVGTSGNSSDLKHTVYHNRDLLIFAEDAQFKLDGQSALTPQTAAMPITTANECDLSVAPVLMGSYVYYANNYGSSVGIRRFEVEADTVVDTSLSITDHIIGFMPGAITQLVSNANQSMLLCRSTGCEANQFFVFESQMVGDQAIYSWCDWKLREGVAIERLDLYNEVITVRYNNGNYMKCDLKSGDTYPLRDVRLDQFGSAVLDANSRFSIPAGYEFTATNFHVLIGNTDRRDTLSRLGYRTQVESDGSITVTITEPLAGVTVFYGYSYEALYEPTRPYERDRQGNARTTDRLRIAHYFLELSNTYHLTRRIISPYYQLEDETFTSLDSTQAEFVDEVNPYTGQWRPQVGMNASDCRVQFIEDSPYAATIASISYRGQQYNTKNRR